MGLDIDQQTSNLTLRLFKYKQRNQLRRKKFPSSSPPNEFLDNFLQTKEKKRKDMRWKADSEKVFFLFIESKKEASASN